MYQCQTTASLRRGGYRQNRSAAFLAKTYRACSRWDAGRRAPLPRASWGAPPRNRAGSNPPQLFASSSSIAFMMRPTRLSYDVDAHDRFVRIRGDAITRVMGEQVADQKLFDEVYRRQLHNLSAFWTPYPFPSIAADDPAFFRPIPRNSWGGASQALTALRTPRWMEHYGKYADFTHLMTRWVEALVRSGQFLQQMDPETRRVFPPTAAPIRPPCSHSSISYGGFMACGRAAIRSSGTAVCPKTPLQPPLSGGQQSYAQIRQIPY